MRCLRTLFSALIITGSVVLLDSCKKEPIIDNPDLLTEDDELLLDKDTLYAKVNTLPVNSVESDGVGIGVLGNLNDPTFGKTYASVYTQFTLSSNNVFFGGNPGIDSIVLAIKYAGTYGKFNQGFDVNVYEVDQILDAAGTYASNQSIPVKVPAVGNIYNYKPNLTDSIRVKGQAFPSHLRIRLNDALGTRILNADTSQLASSSTFYNFFKGLYITTNTGQNGQGLVYLELRNIISRLEIHYHSDAGDSLTYYIPIGTASATINHFDHNYLGTVVSNAINFPNTNGDEVAYIQGGAGTRAKLTFEGLDTLATNIAINKAEVTVYQAIDPTGNDSIFTPPSFLNLLRADDDGSSKVLDDALLGNFGANRVAVTIDGQVMYRYKFNITKHLQKVINSTYNNNGYYLETLSSSTNAERVAIVNPSANQKLKISLRVLYTKL